MIILRQNYFSSREKEEDRQRERDRRLGNALLVGGVGATIGGLGATAGSLITADEAEKIQKDLPTAEMKNIFTGEHKGYIGGKKGLTEAEYKKLKGEYEKLVKKSNRRLYIGGGLLVGGAGAASIGKMLKNNSGKGDIDTGSLYY